MSAWVRRRGDRVDEGYTVVELIVAMFIFSIVCGIFLSGVIVMTRNTVRTEVTADAADSVRRVFQRLDKQVRYADAVNLPGTGTGGRQYVEFRTPAEVAATGVTMCTQWRWDPVTERIETRTWPQTAGTLPGFTTVAEDVVADTSVTGYQAFEVNRATPQHPRQSLTFRVLLESDASAGSVSSESTFLARNSTIESNGNADINADGVSDSPACWRTGVRP